jgi:hypothetical protein
VHEKSIERRCIDVACGVRVFAINVHGPAKKTGENCTKVKMLRTHDAIRCGATSQVQGPVTAAFRPSGALRSDPPATATAVP